MKEDYPAPHDSSDFSGKNDRNINESPRLKNEKRKTRSSSNDQKLRCSQCGVAFLRSSSPCLPFCSIRCQRIDLGNWLDEAYGLPIESQQEQEYGTIDEDDDEQTGLG